MPNQEVITLTKKKDNWCITSTKITEMLELSDKDVNIGHKRHALISNYEHALKNEKVGILGKKPEDIKKQKFENWKIQYWKKQTPGEGFSLGISQCSRRYNQTVKWKEKDCFTPAQVALFPNSCILLLALAPPPNPPATEVREFGWCNCISFSKGKE